LQHFLQIRLIGDDVSIQRHGSHTRQIRFPSHLFLHPSFNVISYNADIAVIRISVPFVTTNTLRPVSRAFSSFPDGLPCRLAGW
jgi:hypothetical protein